MTLKIISYLVIIISMTLTNCSTKNNSAKNNPAKMQIAPVELKEYQIESGSPDEKLIEQGLLSALKILANIIKNERKAGRNIYGEISGSFRIEANGQVRMFLEGKNNLHNEAKPGVIDQFVETIFGGKWRFPDLGQPCLLKVTFQINQ